MKNAQLKLSDVDDDELWLAVRLAQCSSSSSSTSSTSSSSSSSSISRSSKNNQQLSQLQLRSLSTKHYSNIAEQQTRAAARQQQNVACNASNNGQQQSLGSNMLSPQAAAAAPAVAAASGASTKETVSSGNHATTQQQTNIRLCARKRQRMRRRRKRKPETAAAASAAAVATEFETEIVETSSNINISNNLWPTETYMQYRSSNNPSIIQDFSPATFSCLLQVWLMSLQQRAEVLLRGIVTSTTAIISYLSRIAPLLRRRGRQGSNQSTSTSSSSSSSHSHSSSTQIINGLNKHSWIFLLIYLNLSAKVCLAGYHEKRLLHDLLDPYNTLERPVLNESDPLQLSFGLTLMQIIDVDEKNQLLVTNVWLKLEWNDMNLRWNTSDYGGVKDLRIPPHRIWKPDVLMYNSADEGFDGTYQTNVVVRNNGSCLYVPPGIFKSTCKIDITWFPFDDQRCEMKFGSWTYDGFQLDLQLQDETGGDISSYVLNGEWELLGVPGKRNEIYYNCCPEPYIDITFAIIIRRRTLYYFFNLIIPCVLIASMALLGFTLPPDSGEKLSLGVTILLSLTVFLNMVAETMPATSDAVPLLGTYFNCIMFMVASSVVSTILILNYHHRNADTHEMSEWIRIVFLCWLPWILRMSRPGRPLILEFPTTPCSDTSSERKHQILSDVELKERSSKSLLGQCSGHR
ncbi:GL21259 [Drosophila persimilis]|uniref:GL21259 n=1 Tax=Drosophila persimilis TaxID=7234 RepID=B4GX55_DROPE|nr:GL21259 [Drosophila persimilis]